LQRWVRHTASQASRLKIKAEWAHSNRKGLAPQKVADANCDWATGETHQSKIVYGRIFAIFFAHDPSNKVVRYGTSRNGLSWSITSLTMSYPMPRGGNFDLMLKDSNSFYFVLLDALDGAWRLYNYRVDVTDLSLAIRGLWTYSLYPNQIFASKLVRNLNGKAYVVQHGNYGSRILYVPDPFDYGSYTSFSAVGWSANSGGVQLLNYKTSSPFYMLLIIKQGTDNTLFYGIVDPETLSLTTPMTSMNVTLPLGFSDFCAASEVQNVGDPERIHLVYIKGTGELCYRKFENDAWSDETVLVASGASYPVVAVGEGGRLYVFYVKDGVIKLLKFNGTFWENERTLFPNHAYDSPAYLSTNQNVQNGKICLVWTEGSASPYKVMFAYLDDRWV
jgi:hypothetical protein